MNIGFRIKQQGKKKGGGRVFAPVLITPDGKMHFLDLLPLNRPLELQSGCVVVILYGVFRSGRVARTDFERYTIQAAESCQPIEFERLRGAEVIGTSSVAQFFRPLPSGSWVALAAPVPEDVKREKEVKRGDNSRRRARAGLIRQRLAAASG